MSKAPSAKDTKRRRMKRTRTLLPGRLRPRILRVLPAEIIERDYGCGDPSKFVRPGETVLDLGSGGGKICYIASQIVGAAGRVVGVDANKEMLALAEKYRRQIGERIGFQNTEFRYGKIQDLQLDLSLVDEYLNQNPIREAADLTAYEAFLNQIKSEKPLVADESIDVVYRTAF
jgi:SAM-dependent methyltransferase